MMGSVVFCHLCPQQSLTTTAHQQVLQKRDGSNRGMGCEIGDSYCDSEENNERKEMEEWYSQHLHWFHPMKSLFGHAEREKGGMGKERDGDRQSWRKRREEQERWPQRRERRGGGLWQNKAFKKHVKLKGNREIKKNRENQILRSRFIGRTNREVKWKE